MIQLLCVAKRRRGRRGIERMSGALLVAAALLAPPAGSSRAGEVLLPAGFADQPIASGVTNPTGFAFLPDARVLVAEQKRSAPEDGRGFLYLVVGSNVHGPVLTIDDVSTAGKEEGLLGVAVDPGWPARPFAYVHFSHVDGTNRVRRYAASGDLDAPSGSTLAFGSPYEILTDLPSALEFHNGGTLRFGPDGMLYVSQGDDATDQCENLQNPSIWHGVILRLDVGSLPSSGAGPPPKADLVPAGNPFGGPDDEARLTYAIGLRNPFRFTIDSLTGLLYIGDVGERAWEEVNEAQAGDNFGWPLREGTDPFPGGVLCAGSEGRDPIAEYANDDTGKAVIAGPRYRTGGTPFGFPPGYEGDLFYLDFYEGWLRRLHHDGSSWAPADPAPGQPSASNWAEGLEFVSDLQSGPDGAIYYVRRFGEHFFGRIVRVPAVSVDPPTPGASAGFLASPVPVGEGEEMRLEFVLRRAGHVELSLYSVTGARVRVIASGERSAGAHALTLAVSELEPGVYFAVLDAPDARETLRVPVVR